MTLIIIILCLGCFASGFAVSRVSRRSSAKQRSYVLVVSGRLSEDGYTTSGLVSNVYSCKIVPEGIKVNDGTVYPSGVLYPYDLDSSTRLYLAGIEQVALSDHRALERARRSIILRNLFRGGGDILFFAQLCAAILPIIVSVWLTLQIGSVVNVINNQAGNIQYLRQKIDQPLVTQKGP